MKPPSSVKSEGPKAPKRKLSSQKTKDSKNTCRIKVFLHSRKTRENAEANTEKCLTERANIWTKEKRLAKHRRETTQHLEQGEDMKVERE